MIFIMVQNERCTSTLRLRLLVALLAPPMTLGFYVGDLVGGYLGVIVGIAIGVYFDFVVAKAVLSYRNKGKSV